MALTTEDLQAIAELLKPMQKDIKDLQKDSKNIQQDIKDLQKDSKNMWQNIKDIQLTLEHETNRNIRLIAEGHFDLNRKLDNALKIESEKELLLIRVNHLENEVRKVKDTLNQIA
ncbi:MAG: hypothetical protein IKV59_10180 [Lachnospiraceae bacterium]|nr:hypothetical protein [Lachnospiraceae bacterium]